MTPKQAKIIKLYEQLTEVRIVRPSYGAIAKKVPCSKETAWKVIQKYLKQKEAFGLKV